MKINSIRIYSYELPLKRPLVLRDRSYNSRSGLIVEIHSDNNYVGYGEAAPLPFFSNESFDTVQTQLLSARDSLVGQVIPNEFIQCDGSIENWLGKHNFAPSVRFGIESAVMNLVARSYGRTLSQVLNKSSRARVKVNGLLSGSIADVTRQAKVLLTDGYTTFKLKVGRSFVEEEIAMTRSVRLAIGQNAELRLDANQAWTVEQAQDFVDVTRDCDIAYIEEPLANPNELSELRNAKIALDESLVGMSPGQLDSFDGLTAVILKPTMLGLERTMLLARRAFDLNLHVVISSSFESSIGISILAQLAASMKTDSAVGLDTLSWFEDDLLVKPITIKNGSIDLRTIDTNFDNLRRDLLTEVV